MTDGFFTASAGACVVSQTAAMGMAATLFFADRADAAQELMQSADVQNVADLAGIDGRIAIFFVFGPVLGWVAYNILGPGLRPVEDMQKANAKRKGVLAGAGLSAAALMGMPEASEAAQNVGDLAGIDGRIAIFFVFGRSSAGLRTTSSARVFVSSKTCKRPTRREGVLAGAGLSAAALMGMPEASEAAQNVGDLAGIDGRIAIFFVFGPVLGWVAYNILGPGLRQFEDMQKANAKRKGVLAGAGLSAAALMGMPEASEAAQNVGDLAGIDGRIAIFFVFGPVLGWVAYNILGPGLRQFEDMQKANAKRK